MQLGILFRGTSRPGSLDRIRIARGIRSIETPDNAGHWQDFINVILDDEYDLLKIGHPPLKILDLGGNIGLFSLWAQHCFPNSQVHCYEPNPNIQPFLSSNLSGLNVEIFQAAVGPTEGRGSICIPVDNRCSHIDAISDGDVQIDAIATVLSRLGNSVDLMKIDIEGGEWPLLLDCSPEAFNCVKRIVMEYHESMEHKLGDLRLAAIRLGFYLEAVKPNTGFGIAYLTRTSEIDSL